MPTSMLVRAWGPAGPASDAADLTYTVAVLTDWDGDVDPGNVDAALDQLAERVDDNEAVAHATRKNVSYISFGNLPVDGQQSSGGT